MTFRRNDQCLVRSGSHKFQSTVCAAAGCDVCYERAFEAHMMAASAFEPTDLTRWERPCCWDSMTVRHSCRLDCSDCIQSPRPAPTCLAQLCQLFYAEQFAFRRLSLRRTFEYSRGMKKKKNADKNTVKLMSWKNICGISNGNSWFQHLPAGARPATKFFSSSDMVFGLW